MHGILLVRLRPEDAADVAQETFLQAWTVLHTLKEPAAFGSWVGAIARRRAIDHARRQRDETPLVDQRTTPAAQEAALDADHVLAVIRALPAAYRETLVLRLVEGHSGPEIADLTGLTPASVRVNLHRGFKLLRERLGVRA